MEYDLPLGVKSPFTTFDRTVADEAWENISMKQGCKFQFYYQHIIDIADQGLVD